MSCDEYQKKIGKCLVIVHVYLCLPAVPYDCTNVAYIWLHSKDNVHKDIT